MKNRLRLSLFDHSVFSTRILYNNAFISIIRICQLKPFENAFRFIHMLIWLPSSFRKPTLALPTSTYSFLNPAPSLGRMNRFIDF